MKKIAIASILALAVTAASAIEVGINASRANGDRSGAGVTVSTDLGKFGAELGFDRYANGGIDQNRVSLVGTYPVAKFGSVSVTAKAGVAYLNNSGDFTTVNSVTTCRGRSHRCMTSTSTSSNSVSDGFAGVIGVGASMPLTNKLAVTVDYRYQRGQSRVDAFNGSTVSAGLRYSF